MYARFGVFALLLSMLVPLPAFAAGSANVVRTFVYENNLYTYVELNEIAAGDTGGGENRRTIVFRLRKAGNGTSGRLSDHLFIAGR